jgi:hypothetical protein
MKEIFQSGNSNSAGEVVGLNRIKYVPVRVVERLLTFTGWAIESIGGNPNDMPRLIKPIRRLRESMALLRGESNAAAYNAGRFEDIK